ncbi:hypothetical protein ACS0TY_020323 [Phlomoides rotata]
MMSHRKLVVQNEIVFELERSPPSSSGSLTPLLCLLDDAPTETKKIRFNYKSYYSLRKLFPFRDKLIGSGRIHFSPRSWFGSCSLMDDLSLHFRKKMFTGQQKKEELEREVTVLHKMLSHEGKVREYLERLHSREDGSALSIPNFLPPKMKEIVAELAMVEHEIARLESQIKQLQHHKDDVHNEWGRRTSLKNHLVDANPLIISTRPNASTAFDTKALHFISKAIKGDYHLKDFSTNHKLIKENTSEEGARGLFREKISKRNGLLKPPSPLRHPTPAPSRRDRNLDIVSTDFSSRLVLTPLHTVEESIQRWPPNKLSENIMKCLIFIFVRLLRTSRVMELEKSGPIARSTNLTSIMFQKDSRQQDPYGIFDSEESVPRDIGPYKNLVRFTSTSMDLKCIQNSSSVPLFQKLKVLMDGLQKVDLRFLSHQQKLAFWINMYNACIMHGYLQYGVPSVFTPDNTLALINKACLNIAGNTINAQAIEHFILRKPGDTLIKEILGKEKDNKEMIVHELYGLEAPDPNIAFALCCGTRSSPAVKIYTADGVTNELERSKLEYLQAAIVVTSSKRIALPELLLRNMNDFASDKESLMEWVCQQLPTSGSLRKSIVDCFRGVHGGKVSAIVEKIPFEFEFQYLLAI